MVDVPYSTHSDLAEDAVTGSLAVPPSMKMDGAKEATSSSTSSPVEEGTSSSSRPRAARSKKKGKKLKGKKGRRGRPTPPSYGSLCGGVGEGVGVGVSVPRSLESVAVKGGAGNGYRMVLDEPVNKSMLSCHQCKNKKTLSRIIVCGHVYRINNTVKTCTKKYCKSCLLRFYLEAPPTDNKEPSWSSWKCPCCRYICCCAWCRKKKAKRLESVSNAIRAEAHRLTPAISLARKLVSESTRSTNPQSTTKSQTASSRSQSNHNHNHSNNDHLPPAHDIPPAL